MRVRFQATKDYSSAEGRVLGALIFMGLPISKAIGARDNSCESAKRWWLAMNVADVAIGCIDVELVCPCTIVLVVHARLVTQVHSTVSEPKEIL